MRFVFIHSHKFIYGKKGEVYSEGQFSYRLFQDRYLPYCNELFVAGRWKKSSNTIGLNTASGRKVKYYKLPDLSTIRNRRKKVIELKIKLRHILDKADLLIARLPSIHAYYAIKIAKKLNKPYVIEVVGDSFNSLWTHGSLFGKILAPLSYLRNRRIIKNAPYLIYVTESYLQNKYPHDKDAITINASNVNLLKTSENILFRRINKINKMDSRSEIKIGIIGSYASKYKGIDTAINSIKKILEEGIKVKLFILGSGNNNWLIQLAEQLGVKDKIIFEGILPSDKVFPWLDWLDIYIQPSLTEGLPRALIEAMSRALPCIGSSAGGIPELLDGECIHKPKSEKELTKKLLDLIQSKSKMIEQSRNNFLKSREYTSDVLNARRKEFWQTVIERETEKCQKQL